MTTITVIPAIRATAVNQFSGPNSGNVSAASDGTLVIDSRDLGFAMQQGLVPAIRDVLQFTYPVAPAAKNTALLFASAAAANGALALAGSVDVPRQVAAVFLAGTVAVTAGLLNLSYWANDGTAQVDALSLVTAASASKTVLTTKGVVYMTAMAISGLVGGASPTIYIGTNDVLALPSMEGAVDFSLAADFDRGTVQATAGVVANGGFYTPNTAPTGTRIPAVMYSYAAPSAF